MTFDLSCRCGEVYHASAAHAGKRIRCRCGREVVVRPPRPPRASRVRTLLRGITDAVGSEWFRGRGARPPPVKWGTIQAGVALAAAAYVAAAVGAVVLLWLGGDAWWPGTVLLFAGRWVLLVPLLLLLPAAAIFSRKALVPLVGAAVLVLFLVLGFRMPLHPGRLAAMEPGGTPLRVATLNTANSVRVGADLAVLVEQWEADIVALQECGNHIQGAVRALESWHRHSLGSLCLLSRFPIRSAEAMDPGVLVHVERSGLGGTGRAIRYVLEAPSGPLAVANLHLETPRKGFRASVRSGGLRGIRANTTLRDVESRRVHGWLGERGGAELVVGDFNMPVESRIYRQSWAELQNAFSVAGIGFGMTRYNGWIRARIDHILVERGWWVERAGAGADVGSDHRPVVADVRMPVAP